MTNRHLAVWSDESPLILLIVGEIGVDLFLKGYLSSGQSRGASTNQKNNAGARFGGYFLGSPNLSFVFTGDTVRRPFFFPNGITVKGMKTVGKISSDTYILFSRSLCT